VISSLHQSPIRIKVIDGRKCPGHCLTYFYQDPFRRRRTRKSSVPDRVQWFNDKSRGSKPTLKGLTAWAVKRLKTSWVKRSTKQILWLFQPQLRLTGLASFRQRPWRDQRVPDPGSQNRPPGPAPSVKRRVNSLDLYFGIKRIVTGYWLRVGRIRG
jgi:hypothetical protein